MDIQKQNIFRQNAGARQFFGSILMWGIGFGCFQAVMNNYLADVVGLTPFQRGILEFFREMPGLLLVFIIAMMHRFSEWKIMKTGTMISLLGILGLMAAASPSLALATALIVLWSAGEHILMPVRSTIAMNLATEGNVGRSLGFVTGATNAGNVFGSILAAVIFFAGLNIFHAESKTALYHIVWGVIAVLLTGSLFCIFRFKSNDSMAKRPRLYFHRKYSKFYALELFYGARKQIFLTFAPYVLIRVYGMDTACIAVLMGICALSNIFCAPLIGKLTDKFGYKNIMIYDTVILFFVCLVYGYADRLFSMNIAAVIVCINFLADAIISTTSMATSMYVREISASGEETTASLTTGISINHLISIFAALAGGWIWEQFGFGVLFSFAAVMALCNSAFAMTLPKPGTSAAER